MDHDPNQEKTESLMAPMQPVKGSKIVYDFLAAVLGCTFIGWVIDHFCGTKPWAVVAMVIVGFALGVYGAWRSLSQSQPE